MYFEKAERDTRKLLENVDVKNELDNLEKYVDDFFDQNYPAP
jgi:hypothetical protein